MENFFKKKTLKSFSNHKYSLIMENSLRKINRIFNIIAGKSKENIMKSWKMFYSFKKDFK